MEIGPCGLKVRGSPAGSRTIQPQSAPWVAVCRAGTGRLALVDAGHRNCQAVMTTVTWGCEADGLPNLSAELPGTLSTFHVLRTDRPPRPPERRRRQRFILPDLHLSPVRRVGPGSAAHRSPEAGLVRLAGTPTRRADSRSWIPSRLRYGISWNRMPYRLVREQKPNRNLSRDTLCELE